MSRRAARLTGPGALGALTLEIATRGAKARAGAGAELVRIGPAPAVSGSSLTARMLAAATRAARAAGAPWAGVDDAGRGRGGKVVPAARVGVASDDRDGGDGGHGLDGEEQREGGRDGHVGGGS